MGQKGNEIGQSGKSNPRLEDLFATSILEAHLQKRGHLPDAAELSKITKKALRIEFMRRIAKPVIKELERQAAQMLSDEALVRTGFEARLYHVWKEPLDLLECMIKVAIETGEKKRQDLTRTSDNTNNFQRSALIQIHARAIQVANEILTLLKGGFADGANSRWRTLHELAVISYFLRNSSNYVAERYLKHSLIKKFKEAKDYREVCKQLGYPPINVKKFNLLKEKRDELIIKYGSDYKDDYGWLPVALLHPHAFNSKKKARVNFHDLEKHVELTKWRPFYNLSSDAIHGGSRGFYRLGLMRQGGLLLVGPSNYGLVDPLQNTAISLTHVTSCLLDIKPTFEDIVAMLAMNNYVKQIGPAAVKIQKKIEEKEKRG